MGRILEVERVALRFGERVIFQDLDLTLGEKEYLLILGKSGSGKTLLLKLCAGLIAPNQGRVKLMGLDWATAEKEELEALRKNIGFVFQDGALISNMSIFDNVALPLRYHYRWSEVEVRRRVDELMTLLGVDRSDDRSIPAQVSLGMRKRVALARALVLEPQLIFLDQATEGLGLQGEQEINRILREYGARKGASFLAVMGEAPAILPEADRIGVLQDGRIMEGKTLPKMQERAKADPQAAGLD